VCVCVSSEDIAADAEDEEFDGDYSLLQTTERVEGGALDAIEQALAEQEASQMVEAAAAGEQTAEEEQEEGEVSS
jgi:hypothetical protein